MPALRGSGRSEEECTVGVASVGTILQVGRDLRARRTFRIYGVLGEPTLPFLRQSAKQDLQLVTCILPLASSLFALYDTSHENFRHTSS